MAFSSQFVSEVWNSAFGFYSWQFVTFLHSPTLCGISSRFVFKSHFVVRFLAIHRRHFAVSASFLGLYIILRISNAQIIPGRGFD